MKNKFELSFQGSGQQNWSTSVLVIQVVLDNDTVYKNNFDFLFL